MGGAVFHRSRAFEPAAKPVRVESRPLATGYGLLIGAGASLSLWAGLALSLAKILS